MTKGKVYVIGTSHIAKQSVNRIEQLYNTKDPGIIAVELDQQRLFALMHNQKPNLSVKNLFRVGISGYLFMLIGSFIQKRLGRIVGLKPGSDMLAASKLAIKNQKKLLLIDRDIGITLKHFSKEFSWKEKFNLLADLTKGLILRETVSFDLANVPEEELIEQILDLVRKRYPNAYKVLIEDRDRFMAGRIIKAHRQFPDENMLVVVGAGHKKGLIKLLRKSTTSP